MRIKGGRKFRMFTVIAFLFTLSLLKSNAVYLTDETITKTVKLEITKEPTIILEYDSSLGSADNIIRNTTVDNTYMYIFKGSYEDNENLINNSDLTSANKVYLEENLNNIFASAGKYTIVYYEEFSELYNYKYSNNAALIDVPYYDVKRAGTTEMSGAFAGAYNFIGNAGMNNWDTSDVHLMTNLFYQADSFNQYIGDWDTSSVIDMSGMFHSAMSFSEDIGNWNVSNVQSMDSMFSYTNYSGDLNSWDVSQVSNMSNLFLGAYGSFNISDWDVSGVFNMNGMFKDTVSYISSIDNWDVSNVVIMSEMFSGIGREIPGLYYWDTSSVMTMERMFANTVVQEYNGLRDFDTSSVENMEGIFMGTQGTEYIDLTLWNIDNVERIDLLGQPELAIDYIQSNSITENRLPLKWRSNNSASVVLEVNNNLGNVVNKFNSTNSNHVFIYEGNYEANKIDIDNIDVSNSHMVEVSDYADFLNNRYKGIYTVAYFGKLDTLGSKQAKDNTLIDIPVFKVKESGVTSIEGLAYGATEFLGNDGMNDWDLSSVTNVNSAFSGASKFNMPIRDWDTSNVIDFDYMLQDAKTFNQDLTKWWVSEQNTITPDNKYDLFANNSGLTRDNMPIEWAPKSRYLLNLSLFQGGSSNQYGFSSQDGIILQAGKYYAFQTSGYINQKAKDTGKYLTSTLIGGNDKHENMIDKVVNNYTGVHQLGYASAHVSPKVTQEYTINNYMSPAGGDRTGVVTSHANTIFQKPGDVVSPWVTRYNDEDIILPEPEMTRVGMEFTGWYNANDKKVYQPGDRLRSDRDVEFKATFKEVNNPSIAIMIDTRLGASYIPIKGINLDDVYIYKGSYEDNLDNIKFKENYIKTIVNNDYLANVSDVLDEGLYTAVYYGEFPELYNQHENFGMIDVPFFDLKKSKTTSLHSAFFRAVNFVGNPGMNDWDISNVTSLGATFGGAKKINQYIGDWDISSVTNMNGTFNGASIFNSDLSNWNTSNVTGMDSTFLATDEFNSDISKWNTSKVTNMSHMFRATKKFNADIGSWNVSRVRENDKTLIVVGEFRRNTGGVCV